MSRKTSLKKRVFESVRHKIWFCLTGILVMLLSAPVQAGTGGGVYPDAEGTKIVAGVVVDYLGILRFHVLERDTVNPIEGASVELYIPALDRYVLAGTTDSRGVLEMEVAYDLTGQYTAEQNVANGRDEESKLLHQQAE